MKINFLYKLQFYLVIMLQFFYTYSQNEISQGPYEQLVLRGVTLINGNGAPPIGPVDIEIKKNIITKIQVVGYPGVNKRRNGPKLEKNGIELDYTGMFVLPGFIDSLPEKEELKKRIPLNRYGKKNEISEVICFLASEGASYITGQNIRVDGGITKSV